MWGMKATLVIIVLVGGVLLRAGFSVKPQGVVPTPVWQFDRTHQEELDHIKRAAAQLEKRRTLYRWVGGMLVTGVLLYWIIPNSKPPKGSADRVSARDRLGDNFK